MVLVLQTETSDGEMNPAVLVRLQAVPLGQDVEGSHAVGKPSLEVRPHTVSHVLDVTHRVQHGEHSLYNHAGVPPAPLTHHHVTGVASILREQIETVIGQYCHLLLKLSYHRVEGRVVYVGGVTVPPTHQTPLVEHQAKFASHYPTMIAKAFLADLASLFAASRPVWVQQLNAVGVCHSQDGRVSHEVLGPILMGVKQAEQTSAFRHRGEQRQVISVQPSVKSSIAHAFDGEQQRQRHYLAWVKIGLAMFTSVKHLVIYSTKQLCDKIGRSHGVLLFLSVLTTGYTRTLCVFQTSTIG